MLGEVCGIIWELTWLEKKKHKIEFKKNAFLSCGLNILFCLQSDEPLFFFVFNNLE